jgi:hypothetical protein
MIAGASSSCALPKNVPHGTFFAHIPLHRKLLHRTRHAVTTMHRVHLTIDAIVQAITLPLCRCTSASAE